VLLQEFFSSPLDSAELNQCHWTLALEDASRWKKEAMFRGTTPAPHKRFATVH
jgi:hypothetical protein